MKNLKRIILSAALLLVATVGWTQNFKIEGISDGLADGTWLYLKPGTGVPLDSVRVQNNKFSFKGQLTEKTVNAMLYTAKYSNYVFFWLEDKLITMTIKNGEFKKATIKGSDAEDENIKFIQLKKVVDAKQDSVATLLKNAKTEEAKEELQQKLTALEKEELAIDITYVKQHPNSIIATKLLDTYSATWGKEKTNELYQGLSPAMKKSKFGHEIADFIKFNQTIKIGDRFVDFEQLNTQGQKVKLSQLKGKYVLLEFWGSWCGPCRRENPNLVKTYNTFKSKGFEILGVAADNNKEQWLKAVKDDGLPWENVSDMKGDRNIAALIYGIDAYPTNFLIDEKGIIIDKNLRGESLRKKLEELLP